MPWPGCNNVPPRHIHTSQCPIPACVWPWELPCLPHSVPTSRNSGAHSREHASTSGDYQEAPRACQALHKLCLPCCPVCLPLQPLAKLPLYTSDCKWCTKSPAAVKPAGAPFHASGPHMWPLSFLPRGRVLHAPWGMHPTWGTHKLSPEASGCKIITHGP